MRTLCAPCSVTAWGRSRVKGVCAKLFDVKQEYAEYARALEVAAGEQI